MSDPMPAPAHPKPTEHTDGPTTARVTRSEGVKLRTLRSHVVLLTTAGRFWYSNLVSAFDAILSEAGPSVRTGAPIDARRNPETQKGSQLS